MPKLNDVETLAEGLKIGTWRKSKNHQLRWYARMYWKPTITGDGKRIGGQSKYASTGVGYEDGSRYAKDEAKKRAFEMHQEFLKRVDMGISPYKIMEVSTVAQEYIEEVFKHAKSNDKRVELGKEPLNEIEGGKGYWTHSRALDEDQHCRTLEEYWRTLPNQDITTIKERHLDTFDTWGKRSPREWSPSTRNRYIITIRHIWRYAKRQGYVDSVPSPKRAREDLKARSRRDLKIDEYDMIRKYVRDKYINPDKYYRQSGIGDKEFRKTLAYQYHNWIMLMANCGIRPPSGRVDKNLIRWNHFVDEKGNFPKSFDASSKKAPEQIMLIRDEKGHQYKSAIRPDAWIYVKAQMELQKKYKVFKKDGYMFCHCFNKVGQFEKGDPVKSFKKQWNTMLEHLGLDMPVGTPQSKRLVPYSLRGWYMTKRLLESKDLRIEDLASATGTSVRMLMQTYYDFDTSRVYEDLTYTQFSRSDLKPVYDEEGYYIGRES